MRPGRAGEPRAGGMQVRPRPAQLARANARASGIGLSTPCSTSRASRDRGRHSKWGGCVQAFRVHTTQPVGCVRALGEAIGSLREGNARGAQQPYARLRWRVPWGVGVHARGQRPRCRAFGGLRRSASMRACIGSKAKAHMCSDRIALLAYMPKGRDANLGARAPCESPCETKNKR